ncbi:MAG: DUF370 domain-containing protein [Oscillospiraceae bacterium]|nr:DUF370 domain-containing protein [Oscillospiraceae bacterium]
MNVVDIGYSCYVSTNKIVAIAAPDSSPIKRIIQEARDRGSLIDCTFGKKNKSVIITVSDHVILSSRTAEYILGTEKGENADE